MGFSLSEFVGKFTGANDQARAASNAANIQSDAANRGIAEQRRQFDALQRLMAPYVSGGTQAFIGQQELLGLRGQYPQQQAIRAIEQSPTFTSMIQQGENSILQNAAATGGLRGGNIQGALAQFRPQILSALLEQQFNRLGGLSQLGQASAAGQGAQGMQTGVNIANLLGNSASALAGGEIARGQQKSGVFGDVLKLGLGATAGFGPAKLAAGAATMGGLLF